ncbi:Nucleolar protein 11 [Abortiporus biennis]
MSAINDPFVLATYPQNKSPKKPASSYRNVYVTHQQASSSKSDGYATVAAQGDGIHVLELSTLHPAASTSLGPQTTFSCPPVSRIRLTDGSRECEVTAVLETAQDLPSDGAGRTLRRWRQNLSGESFSKDALRTHTIKHPVSSLYVPDEFPDRLVCTGPHCEVSVFDQDFDEYESLPAEDGDLVKSFIFSRRSCSFVPTRIASSQGSILVLIFKKNSALFIRVIAVHAEGSLQSVGDCLIPLDIQVVNASCSSHGTLSILGCTGLWQSFRLEYTDGTSLSLSNLSDPTQLRSLSFLASSEPSSPFANEVSLVALGSSHVLLAGVSSGSSAEITLLLWDLQYSVVLASQTHSIPSSLSRTKKQGIIIDLVGSSEKQDQVLLVLSPNGAADVSNDSARSSILVVPLSVPASSTIANAMGRASSTSKWITPSQTQQSTFDPSSNLEPSQNKLLKAMLSSMEQKRVEAADDAFFNWVSQEEAKRTQRPDGSQEGSKLGYRFVQQLLEIVFRKPKGSSTFSDIPYSPKVVQYLMEKRVVSSGMVDGGLVGVLRLRNDWESLMLAMKTVIDIPEEDIVLILHEASRDSSANPSDDAMQIDSPSTQPSLERVLSSCVEYPISTPPFRLAIHRQIREADEVDRILQVLLTWVDQWYSEDQESHLLPEKVIKNSHGVLVAIPTPKILDGVPSLKKMLKFLQTILDSAFLTLLSHPPSHQLIRRIFDRLQPEVAFNGELEILRGPLEQFTKAQQKALLESTQGPQRADQKVDWRRRRKAAHEQASVAIGLYQVEELVL